MESLTNENQVAAEAGRPIVKVILRKNSANNDVLHFDGAAEDLDIDFSKSDQASLRKLFCWLLDKELTQRADLELVVDGSVKNTTYQKIAKNYVADLNNEIDTLFDAESEAIGELSGEIDLGCSEEDVAESDPLPG